MRPALEVPPDPEDAAPPKEPIYIASQRSCCRSSLS